MIPVSEAVKNAMNSSQPPSLTVAAKAWSEIDSRSEEKEEFQILATNRRGQYRICDWELLYI
jgi:hypothetical protein